MNKILIISVIVSTLTIYLYNPQETQSTSNTVNPIIYEISLRPWLYELSLKYGKSIQKLKEIPTSEFTALKALGVDYVWLMGIWKLGPWALNFDRNNQDAINSYHSLLPDFTMDDIIGSPYAIVDFTCNPELGTDEDIIELRAKLNAMGLKLMLDFVPNHSAVDSAYTETHPEYYIRAPKGSSAPYDSSKYLPNGISYGGDLYDGFWKDTAQWNYFNQDTRNLLKSFVLKIASMSDGMRCDMSMIVLNDLFYSKWRENLDSWGYVRPSQEFWSEAIGEAKSKYPNTVFLAESYWDREQQLIDNGFDFVYEKGLLDSLASLDISKVRSIIDNLSTNYATHSNHFLENHDEPRAITKFGGKDYIADVAAMLSYTLPGAKFINHGQLEGKQNKLEVHLRRSYAESGSAYTKWFYQQLLPIIASPVFHQNSTWQRLSVTGSDSWRYLAWKVTTTSDKILVVMNFSSGKAFANVVVPDAGSGSITITELMSAQSYVRSGDEMRSTGLGVVVDAWNGQIFKY